MMRSFEYKRTGLLGSGLADENANLTEERPPTWIRREHDNDIRKTVTDSGDFYRPAAGTTRGHLRGKSHVR